MKEKFWKRFNEAKAKAKEERNGFDGLIVTIGLILLVMILVFVFRTTIVTQVDQSIHNVGNEINEISTWEAGGDEE